MELDANQMKQFVDFLTEKAVLAKCPACGGQNFSPQKNLVTTLDMSGPKSLDLSPGEKPLIPMLSTVCDNCGYFFFFSSVVVGI